MHKKPKKPNKSVIPKTTPQDGAYLDTLKQIQKRREQAEQL